MRLNQIQERIVDLFSIFVTQVRGNTAMSRTDINRVSEIVMVPLLKEIFKYSHLRNLNYTEYFNYPGIDLGDSEARIGIQVTSTTDIDKIKDALTKFTRYELYKKYDRLIIYVLTEKQRSYTSKSFEEIVQGRFAFDPDRDVIDYRDLLKVVSSFQIDRARRILRLLETNFGSSTFAVFEETEHSKTETVHLNLLQVFFPDTLYQADLNIDRDEVIENSASSERRVYRNSSTRDIARAALDQLGLRFGVDWECHEKKIFTFHDLNNDDLPLTKIIDPGTITSIRPASRFFAIRDKVDENRERVFKSLLRRGLQQKLYGLGVQWQSTDKLYIFNSLNGEAIRKEKSFGRQRDDRRVFERVMKRNKPEEVLYCKHFGFRTNFRRIGADWYLQIKPEWFFSYDGYRRSFYAEEWLAGLKRLENNQSVFNHFRFIEHFLKTRTKTIVDDEGTSIEVQYPHLTFGEHVSFDNAPLLQDVYWNPKRPKKVKGAAATGNVRE